MRILALALVILSFSTQALAAGKSAWQGPGTVSCEEFEKACRRSADNESLFFSWALGFMSGLNTDLLPDRSTDLNGLSLPAQKEFVKSYCGKHPKSAYFAAVFALYNRMRHEQGLPSFFKTWPNKQHGK